MVKRIFLLVLFAIASAGALSAASCSAQAYANACSSCSFDSSGKINRTCSDGYTSGGKSCIATSYPIMAASYQAGKCPEVDSCARDLEVCKNALTSGNDRADCQAAGYKDCFAEADKCIDAANKKCDVKIEDAGSVLEGICGGPFLIGLIIPAFAFSRKAR